MFEYGLKIWSINTGAYYDEARRLLDAGKVDFIELYCVPGSSDTLKKWKKLNIPYVIHAPHFAHGFNLADVNSYTYNINLISEVLMFADELDAENIIFHSGVNGYKEETINQLNRISDSRFLIENVPITVIDPGEIEYFIGTTPEEISLIMNEAKVGFVLDVGHAIASAVFQDIDYWEYLKKFMSLNPSMYHLSDTDTNTPYDDHLNIGKGNLDFNKLKKVILNKKRISIETNKKSKHNLFDYEDDVHILREILG